MYTVKYIFQTILQNLLFVAFFESKKTTLISKTVILSKTEATGQ